MPWKAVIAFWFEESSPSQWFAKDKDFDDRIRSRFLDTYHDAASGKTAQWRSDPEGRLAEVLVLDQFGRNMFRDSPQAFAHDERVLSLAQEAVRTGDDMRLSGNKRYFMYLPYMHSESRAVHRKALWLFLRLPPKDWWSWFSYEYRHKRIIDRFGRYPHRNAILNRASTPEEVAFLRRSQGF